MSDRPEPRWHEHPDGHALAIESTGEAPDWALYDLQREREERSECPNGCGDRMQTLDAHSRRCRECGYYAWGNVPHGRP